MRRFTYELNKNEILSIQETIAKINFYLNNYKNEILDLCKTEKDLENQIRLFQIDYSQFQDLERFSIPIIGKISSGKSTLLNGVLDLKDSLQVQSKATTKFISIIRHNKSLKGKNPKIYSVKFTQRGGLKDQYNFEKDEFIDKDVKIFIEKRNNDLIEKKISDIPQNYFYIIENYIPFFSDENEKYSDMFEFLDIPGLNENSDNLNNDNIYYEKVLPLIINNIKFSLFIFETKNYQNKINSIQLYKKFGNMLNSRKKDYFDENKNINIIQKDSIYILNKIDLCDKESGLQKEKEDFEKYLKYRLGVNLQYNEVVLISLKDSILERDKCINFDNYLNYVIKSKKLKEHFIPNLKERFKIDFSINIDKNWYYDEDEDEDEYIHDKILKLEEDIQSNGFIDSINQRQYDYFKKIFELQNKHLSNSKNDIENLKAIILKSIGSAYNNYINIHKIEKLKSIIEKTFIKDEDKVWNKNLRNVKISSKKIMNNENYTSTINKLSKIIFRLKSIEPNHEFINQIYENFKNTVKYIYNEYKYRIMFIGGISSGKSSIINSLIGYNLDLLPKSSDHCTKIILIIQYINKQHNIALYETKFDKHNGYSSFYFFSKGNLITKGKENVRIKLNELNNNNENLIEIPYYILQTPIEFLDNNISDKLKKEKIEFIDLPGINSENELLENEFLSKLIKYTELFLFINDKNTIQEENKEIIKKFFLTILNEKIIFNLNSILFIVNQIDLIPEIKNKEILNKILEDFSKEINNLYQKITMNDWDDYLKYSKILEKKEKEEKIRCTYFSNEDFKSYKKRMDYEQMIKSIIKDYNTKEIKVIMKQLKKDYLNILESKKDYEQTEIKDFDTNLNNFRGVLSKNNIKEEEIRQNLEEIKEAVKIYSFVKQNSDKIKYKYNFNDFFSYIKERINKENLYFINSMILKLINQLNIDFQRINQNLLRYKTNLKIEFHEFKELKNILNKYKNKVNEKYKQEKKELEIIADKIINEKNNEEYYKEFENKINQLNYFFVETLNIYYQKINECQQNEIEKYSKQNILKNENLIDIQFYENTDYLNIWGKGMLSSSTIGGIIGLIYHIHIEAFANGIICGALFGFGSGLILTPIIFLYESGKYFYKKYKEYNERKEKKRLQFNIYFDKLEIKFNKILKDMDEIYFSKNNDIRLYKISQQKPMNNIFNKIKSFEKIEEEFKNVCLEFKE